MSSRKNTKVIGCKKYVPDQFGFNGEHVVLSCPNCERNGILELCEGYRQRTGFKRIRVTTGV